jgi:hypothetical protein
MFILVLHVKEYGPLIIIWVLIYFFWLCVNTCSLCFMPKNGSAHYHLSINLFLLVVWSRLVSIMHIFSFFSIINIVNIRWPFVCSSFIHLCFTSIISAGPVFWCLYVDKCLTNYCRLKKFVPITDLSFAVLVPVNWTSDTLESLKVVQQACEHPCPGLAAGQHEAAAATYLHRVGSTTGRAQRSINHLFLCLVLVLLIDCYLNCKIQLDYG